MELLTKGKRQSKKSKMIKYLILKNTKNGAKNLIFRVYI